jgi:hypothetical protein
MADKLTFCQGVGVAGPWNPAFGGGFGLERGAPPNGILALAALAIRSVMAIQWLK